MENTFYDLKGKLSLALEVFNNISDGILVTDSTSKNIIMINSAFKKITGYDDKDILGNAPSILKSGWHGKDFYEKMWAKITSNGFWQGEVWDRRKNGELYAELLKIFSVKNDEGIVTNYIGIVNEITEQKLSEENLNYLSYYDTLTGLPNRHLFLNKLTNAIDNAKNNNIKIAVIYIDIDRFKMINDSFSHQVGDTLLLKIAERLSDCTHNKYTLSRLTADEFAIIVDDVKDTEKITPFLENIKNTFIPPFILNDYEVFTTCSIGVGIFPDDGETAHTLLKNADSAMDKAKKKGGNNFLFYKEEMNSKALEKIKFESGLRHAIENKELFLQYQPQVTINGGKVIGMEALVRWNSPKVGIIPPGSFIPLAEETGLIIPIGEYVLREACMQSVRWIEKGLPPLQLAVNLSAKQFRQKNLFQTIKKVVDETSFDTKYLELELTESSLMENMEESIELLHQFKKLGIEISIDDFGTGYSSFAYLKKLPIDKLKIDQSFIKDIDANADSSIIVETIINMAHNLNLKVIAEGVETESQLNFLIKNKCDEIQGYYFSKPLSPHNFEEFIINNKKLL